MKTHKIREALAVLGDLVDVNLADAALNEVRALEAEASISHAALRDTFAAAALTGMLAAPDMHGEPIEFARGAYLHAAAMLAAREGM